MKQKPIKTKQVFKDYTFNYDVFHEYGCSICTETIPAQEQREAAKYGIMLQDLIKMYKQVDNWQSDC